MQYTSNLTDGEWRIVKTIIPPHPPNCRPRKYDMREILNGIFYTLRTGCVWRDIPKDLPPWDTCYHHFSRFSKDGTWQKIHDKLRTKVRKRAGKKPQPTAGIIDSQSVKTTQKKGFAAMMRAKR